MPGSDNQPWVGLGSDTDHRAAEGALVAAGWTPCGAGDWAIALASPDGTLAARISPFDPVGPLTARLYREAAPTSRVPALVAHVRLEGGGDLQILDRLHPVDRADAEAFLADLAAPTPALTELSACLRRVHAEGERTLAWLGSVDRNPTNVMRRSDGTLVLADPFYADGPHLYPAAVNDPDLVARTIAAVERRHMTEIPCAGSGPWKPGEQDTMRAALAGADARQAAGGIALAARFAEVVRPIVAERWPALAFATARLGSGSDAQGLDDATSRDHDWGLRLTLLVDDPTVVEAIDTLLEAALPEEVAGHPVRFATTWDPLVRHKVEVATVDDFIRSRTGFHPDEMDAAAWLCTPGQAILEVAGGPVFFDSGTTLISRRDALASYPDDVWRHVLAAGWQRLGADLPLVGRTADRGDDLGSRIVAARLCTVVTLLAFVVEQRWMPYPKWTTSRLVETPLGRAVQRHLALALQAETGAARGSALAAAAEVVHRRQRDLGISMGPAAIEPFFDRGHLTVAAALVDELRKPITEAVLLRRIPAGLGAIDQWSDAPALLMAATARRAAASALRRSSP